MDTAFHESTASRVPDKARFAPSVSFVLIPFLFAGAAVLYTQIVRYPDCRFDLPVSEILIFSALAWLASRSLSYSNLRSPGQKGQAILPSWSFIVLGFCPSALYVLHGWRACLAAAPAGAMQMTDTSYQAGIVVLVTLFLLAVVDAIGTAHKSDFDAPRHGVSEYVTMPAALIALALYLGSPRQFSYLSDAVPVSVWTYVLGIRYAAIAVVFLLVVADAFLILTPLLAESRTQIDALADRFLSPHRADTSGAGAADVAALRLLNGAIVVLRYVFQLVFWAGLAVAYFAVAFFQAAWRFAVNAGTQFALAVGAIMISAVWLASKSLTVMGSVRDLVSGRAADGRVAWFLAVLFFFMLGLCVVHTYISRPRNARFAAIADGAGFVAGFAIVGLWIATIVLHLVASVAAWGNFDLFRAPGFAGLASLGLFFRVMLAGLFVVSVAGLISLRLARRRAA